MTASSSDDIILREHLFPRKHSSGQVMVPRFPLAVVVAFVAAGGFFPVLALGSRARIWVLLGLSLPILLSPILIPAEKPFLRFLMAVIAVTLVAKLYDLHIDAKRGSRPGLRAFLGFVINPFSVVLRKLDAEPRPSRRENLVRLARATACLALGSWIFLGLFRVDWHAYSFAVEHTAKVIGFYLAVLPGTAAAAAGWRLLGGAAREIMNRPLVARTPADFWRRYNRPAQQFFYEDIFKPAGGLHMPVRATLAIFALSSALHEYVFGIAIGRVQGYQTAFFMLQGITVATTLRIRPRGWNALAGLLGTWAFNIASSVLFFASMNGIAPFYVNPLPAWLPGTGASP